jgi:arginyl-tRNA synthetase
VTYLFSVAQLFNGYYASTQIIVEGDDVGNANRLMIVKRVKVVLRKGLYVLGIVAPERM